jgi:H3 lysine-79-specific histone-lysine N-methyltransferase
MHPKIRDGYDYHPVDDIRKVCSLLEPAIERERERALTQNEKTIRLTLDYFLTPSQSLSLFGHDRHASINFAARLSHSATRSVTPQSDSGTPAPEMAVPLLRVLERAANKKDGPAFVAAVERFNDVMRRLKKEGKIDQNIRNMAGVNKAVWTSIFSQSYERVVGPRVKDLKAYEAFSDNV